MASERFEVELTADDSASPVIDRVADSLDDLTRKPTEVEVDADVSSALSALDDVAAEAKRTQAAAAALAQALGPELGAKADTTRIVGELRQMGLTFDQIEGNADQLGAKLRELSDADVGGKMGASLGTTRGQIDQMSDSARGANSALANMVGNAAQDVGALGGVAGSAGVALGQMAEYASDAALGGESLSTSLSSMLKVAGPIAVIGTAIGAIGQAFQTIEAEKAFRAELVEKFSEAMREAGGVAGTLREEIEATGKLAYTGAGGGFLGLGQQAENLIPILDRLQLGYRDFANMIQTSGAEKKLYDQWQNAVRAGDPLANTYKELFNAATDYAPAAREAAAAQEAVNRQLQDLSHGDVARAFSDFRFEDAPWEKANEVFGRITTSLSQGVAPSVEDVELAMRALGTTDPAEVFDVAGRAMDAASEAADANAQAVRDATAAWQDYVSVVKSQDWQQADIEGALGALTAYRDGMFGLFRINADYQEAVDGLTQSLKDNGDTFDLATEKGRANQAALEDVAAVLDTRLVAAYGEANGSLADFQTMSEAAFQQLVTDLGLGAEQAEALRMQLGMTPAEVETRFKLSQDAEAMQKLQLLQGAISALPPEIQLQIGAKIAEGDIIGAAQLATTSMNNAVANQPVVMPLDADPKPALDQIADVTSGDYLANMGVEADTPPAQDAIEDVADADYEAVVVAEPDIARADAALATLARDRRLKIIADADTASANGELATAARDRRVIIFATASTGSADAALDALTRQRTVTIVPRVAPTTVLVRVDGGG